jgi:hypothetical protein
MLRTPASRVSSIAIIVGLVAWAVPARASSITWEFSALIGPVPRAYSQYAALANTEIYGQLSFDSNQPTQDPNHSSYRMEGFVINLPAIHSTWTYQGGGMDVFSESWRGDRGQPCIVGDGAPNCLLMTGGGGTSSNPDGPPPLPFEIRFNFKGFPTADIPLAPPPGYAYIGFPDAFYCPICGFTNDMHVTPEPTTLTLLGAGLVTVGWGRYRRRQRRSRS